jgi:hypothetical protein
MVPASAEASMRIVRYRVRKADTWSAAYGRSVLALTSIHIA